MSKYTVGQIAKSLGVSTQTLRHYESLGLITSHRNDDNQYRTYTVEDTRILFMISIYRSMGFSLPKIKEMLQEMTINEVKGSFEQRIHEVNEQIYQLEMMKQELQEYHRSIEMAEKAVGTYWIEKDGHTMVSVMKSGSGFSLNNEKDNQLVEYQKLAPHVRQGFVISKSILDGESSFDFQYGVFMNKDYAKKILTKSEMDRHLVTIDGPIAKTVIKTQGENFSKKRFEPFFEWIESQGYKIASDLYGVVRYHAYYEQEVSYFEFLVSVHE
ncbi:MAG: MerR family transcriptional regulator [Erysipelotrichaceae bacterium]|nr:MerR family transcriptional regulator [Erysipelotrichaceae bacterium]